MAIISHNFKIGFRDVGKSNKLTNRGLIGFLEDIAGIHSNIVGYGLNDIQSTGLTWILLNWKIRVLKRPIYGDEITIKTWARNSEKFFTFRDYEVFDSTNCLIAKATSKWLLLNANTLSIEKITNQIMNKYEPENINVFNDEPEINKISDPKTYSSLFTYTVQRKDIDINDHMHNVYYLDLAYEALPEDIYKNYEFNNFEIMYKKEIKLGETVKCFYSNINDEHYITIKSENEKVLHTIIKFKK